MLFLKFQNFDRYFEVSSKMKRRRQRLDRLDAIARCGTIEPRNRQQKFH